MWIMSIVPVVELYGQVPSVLLSGRSITVLQSCGMQVAENVSMPPVHDARLLPLRANPV